jgi:SAM-dependent methyltransferase
MPDMHVDPVFSLPGMHESPNIQVNPDIYEIENLAADPNRSIEEAMWRIAPWQDKVVLDLGSGTGFHVPRFHERARHVFAVEPHGPSHLRATNRFSSLGLERASAIRGSAEAIPLPDQSVEIVHARFAYFFGPGTEAGLAELERVVSPGGTVFIIDNDLTRGQFADWLRLDPVWQPVDPFASETFYASHGFTVDRIGSEWRFASRDDLEAVVRIEFSPDTADIILRRHRSLNVSYGYLLMHRQY